MQEPYKRNVELLGYVNTVDLPTHPLAKSFDKMNHQGRNVFATLTQRRQHYRKDIQAKVKVATRFAVSYHLCQVAMSRGHQPNIRLVSSTAAQALEFLFLQCAQQFGLQLQRNIADLFQKESALFGQLEAAKLLRYGSSDQSGALPTQWVAIEF